MKKLFSIIVFGLILRLIVVFISRNFTNYDLESYYLVGELISKKINIYPEIARLHHPYFPFFLYLEWLAYLITKEKIIFVYFIKMINIIFDLFNIYLVFLLTNKDFKKAFLYAINPISILTFCFHGQFDAIPIFFLLLSIYLITKKRDFLAGLVFSFAVMVKTWPLIFLFSFLKRLKNKKLIFLIIFFPIVSVFLYGIFFKGKITEIFITLISYQGLWGVWGWTLFFTNLRFRLKKLVTFIFLLIFIYKSIVINKTSIIQEIFYLLIFFFIFTTNFSIQYFSWFTPFLVIEKPKNYSLITFFISSYLIFNYLIWSGWKNIFLNFNLVTFLFWLIISVLFFVDIEKNKLS